MILMEEIKKLDNKFKYPLLIICINYLIHILVFSIPKSIEILKEVRFLQYHLGLIKQDSKVIDLSQSLLSKSNDSLSVSC